jgi:hypothetical protein
MLPSLVEYEYAVDRRGERLYWYDPQPHPNDPALTGTFPHHKHVQPDPPASSGQNIKRNCRTLLLRLLYYILCPET